MGWGSRIRDLRSWSRKNIFRLPDPEVKRDQDPGSGTATLPTTEGTFISFLQGLLRRLTFWEYFSFRHSITRPYSNMVKNE
jgi:hypothetical protein